MSATAAAATATHDDHGHASGGGPLDEFGAATTGKIGMWIFLLSDALSFSGLLLGYAILRAGTADWPDPSSTLGINFTALLTFLLICSSVTMVLAFAAATEKNKSKTMLFLGLTILGGVLFLLGQRHEYMELYEREMTFGSSNFMSTFYVVTSFHGCHVFSGVCYLTIILVQVARGKFVEDGNTSPIELVGLFWHFVDLIWILVFTFVYLL
jgi:heme/copper-type cytochrome/quinol oxidase subunit 3